MTAVRVACLMRKRALLILSRDVASTPVRRVHYARVPKSVGSADICRELLKRFKHSELKCVQDYGMGKFEVTFASDEASRRFSDDPVLAIRDARIRF
ncbi:hypothetical protein MRX96_051968 [Rhipicephalus microplus]